MNTSVELYEENTTQDKLSHDDILMNEYDILQGLIDLGSTKNDEENYRTINIKRNGVLKLSFRIRPISEEENHTCYKHATKYAPSKPGKPKTAIETDPARYRSFLIYTATVNEDRQKVWDNKKAIDALDLLSGVDMIDKVLLAGEKSRVIDVIDEISGFDDSFDENAKN